MREERASRFISVIAKSIQAACHGCVDFSRNVQVLGHIYLSVDSQVQYDYVLNERLCRDVEDSHTVVFSSSFHAEHPQDRRKQSVTTISASNSTIGDSHTQIPVLTGNYLISASPVPSDVDGTQRLENEHVESSSNVVHESPASINVKRRKKRKGSPSKIKVSDTCSHFDDDFHVSPVVQEERQFSVGLQDETKEREHWEKEELASLDNCDHSPEINLTPTDNAAWQLDAFHIRKQTESHPQNSAESSGNGDAHTTVDLSIVKKECVNVEGLPSCPQRNSALVPASATSLPFQSWGLQRFQDEAQLAGEGVLQDAKLPVSRPERSLGLQYGDGLEGGRGSQEWMQVIPAVDPTSNSHQVKRVTSGLPLPVWPIAPYRTPPVSVAEGNRFVRPYQTPPLARFHGNSSSSNDLSPWTTSFMSESYSSSGGKSLSTAAMRMRRYRQRLKEDREKYELHRQRQSRYAKTYLSSLSEEQKAKRREKVKLCMREWRRKRKEKAVKQELGTGSGGEGMHLSYPLYPCTPDEPAELSI